MDDTTADTNLPTLSGTGRPYPYDVTLRNGQTVTVDGISLAQARNGTIYRTGGPGTGRGRIVGNPVEGSTSQITTPERARELINARWDSYVVAAGDGLARATGHDSSHGAWAEIVGAQGRLATDITRNASTDAARFVGRAIGALTDGTQEGLPPGVGARIEIDAGLLASYLRAKYQARGIDIDLIDGQISE